MKRLVYRRELTAEPHETPTVRFPRVRFTVRWMLVAVAVVAVALAGALQAVRMSRLADVYYRKAAEFGGVLGLLNVVSLW